MAAPFVQEVLPPTLSSGSQPPLLFDGTTRLYIDYQCPFAQRSWIARNYKGLQDQIKLVAINLLDRPAWYKERVYEPNATPSLEHNGRVIGESLDLLKYIDSNFDGPALLPDDAAKREFAEELLSNTSTFSGSLFTSFKGEDPVKESGPSLDHLEDALQKFDDGPFFLGQFSLVDAAYAPFVERFKIFFQVQYNYDITTGRPKLAAWIEELEKLDAYKQTKCDPELLVYYWRKRFVPQQ